MTYLVELVDIGTKEFAVVLAQFKHTQVMGCLPLLKRSHLRMLGCCLVPVIGEFLTLRCISYTAQVDRYLDCLV